MDFVLCLVGRFGPDHLKGRRDFDLRAGASNAVGSPSMHVRLASSG
jgi:hypothetical protein